MSYYPTPIQKHARSGKAHSQESAYWKRYRHPVFIKNYSPVTSIHFAPTEPHRYAVTSAMRVQIYAPRTQKVLKTISRFDDVARSGNIRSDGKLLVAGDDSGAIQLFDINSRAVLRTLSGHKQPVHVTRFSTTQTTQLLSCSDDTTVKLWDIPSQSPTVTFFEHTDYVRSGVLSNLNPSLILTGSYDSTIRLFDSRTGRCEILMGNAESGQAPVEDILLFPSGTMALSSSGPILKVWDLVAGGRCIRALSNHQKTITCLAFDGKAGRVLTGGLDQMVKVYDVSTYRVVHTMRYSAPVLCLAMSPDDTHIAAGMTDGTLSIRRRNTSNEEAAAFTARKQAAKGGDFETLMDTIGDERIASKGIASESQKDPTEIRVQAFRPKRLPQYDQLMKKFRYGEALDAAMAPGITAVIFFSVIQELIHRDGLRAALSGRDDVLLEPIIRMLSQYVSDVRWGELACEVAAVILDIYSSVIGLSPVIDAELANLRSKVQTELRLQDDITRLRGALDMLLSSSVLASA